MFLEPRKLKMNLPSSAYVSILRNSSIYDAFSMGNWFWYLIIGSIVTFPIGWLLNGLDEALYYLKITSMVVLAFSYLFGLLCLKSKN